MPAEAEARTEPATPRRRNEARSKGNVARSHDLVAAVLLLTGILALRWIGPDIWKNLLLVLQHSLTWEAAESGRELLPRAFLIGGQMLRALAPMLLLLLVVGLVVLYAQIGWLVTFEPVKPKFDKLNPVNGFMRLLSGRTVAGLFTNLGKLLVVAVVAVITFIQDRDAILFAFTLGFPDVVLHGGHLLFRLGIRLAAVLLIMAIIDYAYQRYRHEKDLRMTKEEIKDEMRSMEGDPDIRRRRRKIQMQLAVQRIKRAVPKADVVVTNPEHVAVAIQYDADTMPAPRVIAKGADYLAQRIRQVAAEFGVPIVQRPPLARAMYESVEVGQYIPEKFYQAIAEILAYVYELSGRSRMLQAAGAP